MSTQFDLEQQIMDCWHVVDDLKVVTESVLEDVFDSDKIFNDKIFNILIGMETLYQLKFERMFRTFEKLQKEHYEALKPSMTREQLYERVVGKIDEMLEGIDENNSHGDVWAGSEEYGKFYEEHPEALPKQLDWVEIQQREIPF